jgi:cell division protein FtsQ
MRQLRRPRVARPRRRRLPRDLRRVALWGAPAALIVGIGAGVVLSGRSPGQGSAHDLSSTLLSATGALGLTVDDIEVEGRTTTDTATILAALGAHAGSPILAVNPAHAKEQLEALPWVRSASIERRLPGTIYVRLVERTPLAVWQHDKKWELIDRDGTVIPVSDLSRFANLPTVVGGDQARHSAADLIDLLSSEPDLAARVTAVILVGDRRWDLRIDNAIEVMLPEDDAAGAWTRLAKLERINRLLQRDVQTVDMRLPDRLVMRVNDPKDATPAKKIRVPGKST